MIWVGSFKSLRSALHKPRFGAPLEVHTWLRSNIGLISPFVDWLMSLVARTGCVPGKEEFVELALREAVSNAADGVEERRHTRRLHKTARRRSQLEVAPSTEKVIVYHPRRPHGADPLRESRESWHACSCVHMSVHSW